MWLVEKIEISGGFLPGLSINVPQGLTCIIGARGSGKSTLAEAVRFAICGLSSAPKPCADLVQANLAGGALVTITALAERAMSLWPNKGEADTRPPLGSGYERVAPVMPRRPFVPAGAPGELRLDAKKSDIIPDYPY